MVLSDGEIKKRVRDEKLLEFYRPEGIKYCGYELTLGRGVEPDTGNVLSLDDKGSWWRPLKGNTKCFVINPAETMIAITKETLNMPPDLCASYGQLNRWANRGLMVLNTSVVEPGYSGPLSCVLVNFSSQRITLSPGDPIAKLNFQTVQGKPDQLYRDKFTEEEYDQVVSKMATNLPVSLLDISGVEERITKKVRGAVQRSITFGGLIILVLLVWSQMEGFLSEWIYNRTGLMTTTKQFEVLLKQQQVEFQAQTLQLEQEIDQLKAQKQGAVAKGADGGAAKK
jgi:deoxycytidine triphosphate deaminase